MKKQKLNLILLCFVFTTFSFSQETIFKKLQGTWISTTDKSYSIQFKENYFKEISSGKVQEENKFWLAEDCNDEDNTNIGEDYEYINIGGTWCAYYIVSVDKNNLTLSVNGRGNLLTFSKQQKKAKSKFHYLEGKWIGEMNNKQIEFFLEKIDNLGNVSGYNIVGNNKRPISGTIKPANWDQPCSIAHLLTLKEPGNQTWDGVFTIKFIAYQDEVETDEGLDCGGEFIGTEAEGSWKANNGKANKKLTLTKN